MSSLEGPRDFFIDDAADFHLEDLKGVVGEQLRNHLIARRLFYRSYAFYRGFYSNKF